MRGPAGKTSSRGGRLGFTLIEMVVVIAITGIVASMVAVFIRRPVEGYVDAVRRAQISDVADTALRRIMRDLRLALPNSVRVTGTCSGTSTCYLEFILTSGGGRYRAALTSAGGGDPLDFTTTDSSFDVIGPPLTFAGGESIVVYNLGIGNSDAYAASNNRATYGGAAGSVTNITLNPAKQFPLESPGNRFQVVAYPVTYECNPTAGVNQIKRYWNYGFNPAQVAPPSGGSQAQLASSVSSCFFTYNPNSVQGRNGVVSMSLQLTGQGGETEALFQETHVSNAP